MSDKGVRIGCVLAVPISFVILTAGALTGRIAVFIVGLSIFALAFSLLFLTEARHALDRRQEP